jgi:hypothetical protein
MQELDPHEIEFDQTKFDRLVVKAADATITDEDLESLLRMHTPIFGRSMHRLDDTPERKLAAAINSYCHIVRITREYEDVDVDLETSRALAAKSDQREPYTDEEIRLIGKRSSNSEADENLEDAFWDVVRVIEGPPSQQPAPFMVVPVEFYTTLSDEQFRVLAESLFEQAIVQGTTSVTDKADFSAAASGCPKLARRLYIAHVISLLTEGHDSALRYSKLSPEEKARRDRAAERLHRAIHGLPGKPQG